jgi:molybdopterin/thiamine biosynthesis adenylyltransferase
MTTDRLPLLTSEERVRYARHLTLPDLGEEGQRRLKAARVLIVGLGGLGSPIALYLAAAGVGTLGLVDADVVDVSNLQRQVLHSTSNANLPKTLSAEARLSELNPNVHIHLYPRRFEPPEALELASGYDLIMDGTDNFASRYVINDVCLELGIPFIYGAVFQLEGQASLLCAPEGPCYRCLFPVEPPREVVRSPEEAGILGVIPGTIGTIQATEAIKWIAGLGLTLVGRLLVYDAREMRFDSVKMERNPDCPSCGDAARNRKRAGG